MLKDIRSNLFTTSLSASVRSTIALPGATESRLIRLIFGFSFCLRYDKKSITFPPSANSRGIFKK